MDFEGVKMNLEFEGKYRKISVDSFINLVDFCNGYRDPFGNTFNKQWNNNLINNFKSYDFISNIIIPSSPWNTDNPKNEIFITPYGAKEPNKILKF